MEEKKQIETKRERSKSPKTKGGLENRKATANPHDIEVKEVTLASTLTEAGYRHAVHCMIFARWDDHYVLEEYKPHAAVLMQLRFDGCIGFAGGLIDESMHGITVEKAEERAISAVQRELAEEMNIDSSQHVITQKDYVCTYRHPTKKLFSHFYCHEMSMDNLRDVENMALKSMDFGNEVLGVIRVPLYTMYDGHRGFPAFLNNNFIFCARHQLLQALELRKILTKSEIEEALKQSRNMKATHI